MPSNIARKSDGSLDVEAYKHISGRITADGLKVDITVIDARMAYGRLDFCVTPKSGEGSKWVSAKNVALTKEVAPTITPLALPARDDKYAFGEEVARRKAESRLRTTRIVHDAEIVYNNIKNRLAES